MTWSRWLTAWLTACVFAAATIVAAESNRVTSTIGSARSYEPDSNVNASQNVVAGCGIWALTGHASALPQTHSALQGPNDLNLRGAHYSAVQSGNDESADMSIVGFWKFTEVAEGNGAIPDGSTVDAGFAQWHSDGTEIMNSSRPPATQSFCLGVWRKTGGATYSLNHFALSWDLSGHFVGPANIREDVKVGHGGQTYTGTFTIDQFDQSGNVIAHITGDVTATRITVNTTPAEIR